MMKRSAQCDTHDDAFRPPLDSPIARPGGSCTHNLPYLTISFSEPSATPSEYSGLTFPFSCFLFPRMPETGDPSCIYLYVSSCAMYGWFEVKESS